MDVDTVLELFRDEVKELGGRATDVVAERRWLYARSVLPDALPILPEDFAEPGIALRYARDSVEVRPYLNRVVCDNGQILACSDRGGSIRVHEPRFETSAIRQLIHEVAAPETFRDFVAKMRDSRQVRPDSLMFLMELRRHPGFDDDAILELRQRMRAEGASNLFEIGNVVTAFARDTRDPQQRWDRECVGAAIFARLIRPAPARGAHAGQPIANPAG